MDPYYGNWAEYRAVDKKMDDAIKTNNLQSATEVLQRDRQFATSFNLEEAAKYNSFDVVRLLVTYGAEIERGSIYRAIRNSNIEMVRYLIERIDPHQITQSLFRHLELFGEPDLLDIADNRTGLTFHRRDELYGNDVDARFNFEQLGGRKRRKSSKKKSRKHKRKSKKSKKP
jgi:hypothetical protein